MGSAARKADVSRHNGDIMTKDFVDVRRDARLGLDLGFTQRVRARMGPNAHRPSKCHLQGGAQDLQVRCLDGLDFRSGSMRGPAVYTRHAGQPAASPSERQPLLALHAVGTARKPGTKPGNARQQQSVDRQCSSIS